MGTSVEEVTRKDGRLASSTREDFFVIYVVLFNELAVGVHDNVAEQVILQMWISSRLGVISKRHLAADDSFGSIKGNLCSGRGACKGGSGPKRRLSRSFSGG